MHTVTATLTNSRETENSSASLFSEKRQIVAEDVTIKPHEKVNFKFIVDIEDVYYKVYSTGFTDDMLNISVSGENTALSSLIVEKYAKKAGKIKGTASDSVNDGVTLWACTDITAGTAQHGNQTSKLDGIRALHVSHSQRISRTNQTRSRIKSICSALQLRVEYILQTMKIIYCR